MPGRDLDDHIAIKRRQCAPGHDQNAVRGSRESPHGVLDLTASRTSIGINSTPTESAAVWTLPIGQPGRAKLLTMPAPTVSEDDLRRERN